MQNRNVVETEKEVFRATIEELLAMIIMMLNRLENGSKL